MHTSLTHMKLVVAGAIAATLLVTNAPPAAAVESTVFSFGPNIYGQTGLGTTSGNTLVATPIVTTNLADRSVTQVAADDYHSLLLADDGTVFSFGLNGSGRTGLGTTDGNTLIATPIVTTNLAGKTITQVSAGLEHSLLLADDGTVFSFGYNGSGRTGLGTTDGSTLIATPIVTTYLAGKTITQIAAGQSHNLLLADDGTVFSFGSNGSGQLGRGEVGNTPIATPIITTNLAGKRITQVAAAGQHSLLLADDGAVFSFGWNINGQTGVGAISGRTPIATPIDTTHLAGRSITQIAAGWEHNLLLADDGTVFSFGANIYGKTGLGTTDGNTPVATPIVTTNLAGKTITQIAAANQHNLLLADDGTVFSFGNSGSGRTGLGINGGSTPIATPIDTTNLAGQTITQVAAGGYHSLLLAAPAAGGLAGDFNADGAVDGSDFLTWQRGLGTFYTADDLQTWKAHFGAPAGGAPAVAPGQGAVPEPAALVLVLTAMIARLGETRPRGRVSPRLESP